MTLVGFADSDGRATDSCAHLRDPRIKHHDRISGQTEATIPGNTLYQPQIRRSGTGNSRARNRQLLLDGFPDEATIYDKLVPFLADRRVAVVEELAITGAMHVGYDPSVPSP